MQLPEHLAPRKWLRQHIPFPLAKREKAWKTLLGNDPPSGLHRKLLPLQDNAQRHNPVWNTVNMKHKITIALNRNYITRTIYNSKAKCLWSVCFQILSFLKIFFLAVANSSQLLCWMRIEYFTSKWRQDAQITQINPIIFFEIEEAVWTWTNLRKNQDSSNLLALLDR